MNRRVQVILVVALVVAVLCAYLVWQGIGSAMRQAEAVKPKGVIAAKTNIKVGAVLSDADLSTIQIVGQIPKGMTQDKKALIGHGVIEDLYEGEPIIEDRLAGYGIAGLATKIPTGMRGVAVKVDEVVGVSGFVAPETHVDVLISGTPPDATASSAAQGPLVRTLLQNLTVLSAGTEIEKDPEGKAKQVQVVNLLVTPEQAETLSLAGSQTKVQLAMRNPLDTQVAVVPGNDVKNLYANGKPQPKPVVVVVKHKEKAPKPEGIEVDIFSGTAKSSTTFSAPEGKQ